MSDMERYGVLICLREMNGYTLLDNGRWQEPQWMRDAQRAAKGR